MLAKPTVRYGQMNRSACDSANRLITVIYMNRDLMLALVHHRKLRRAGRGRGVVGRCAGFCGFSYASGIDLYDIWFGHARKIQYVQGAKPAPAGTPLNSTGHNATPPGNNLSLETRLCRKTNSDTNRKPLPYGRGSFSDTAWQLFRRSGWVRCVPEVGNSCGITVCRERR